MLNETDVMYLDIDWTRICKECRHDLTDHEMGGAKKTIEFPCGRIVNDMVVGRSRWCHCNQFVPSSKAFKNLECDIGI